MKGYTQVYTGGGKGKTTAALGLALRAAGAGHRVFIAQFMKGVETSEAAALERVSDLIELRQYGSGRFVLGRASAEERERAAEGLSEVRRLIASGRYRVVVLDEANMAVFYNLLSVEDLLALIEEKPPGVELVITGRGIDPRVIERADLVTEMREIKHYYTRGVAARLGIEM